MREFLVSVSKHRPDGLLTVWIDPIRKFTLRELLSKKRKIYEDVERGIVPIRRFFVAFQEGFSILDSDLWNFYHDYTRLIEFVIEPFDFSILLYYLRHKWGGMWHVEWCRWDDPWAFTLKSNHKYNE